MSTRALADDPLALPVLRLALGPAIHTAPAADESTRLAVDITAGAGLAPLGWKGVGVILNPELGYAFDSLGTHAFNVVAGIGYGSPLAYASYRPRFLVGDASGNLMVGMRNGLAMHLLLDMVSLEFGHQFASYGGALHHDVRVLFGVNPASFVYAINRLSR